MSYSIENGMWRSVFAVPTDIVDSKLKFRGETQLKVLLALLRYNGGLDISALSAIVGKTEPDVRDAVKALVDDGIIKGPGAVPEANPVLQYVEVAEAQPIQPQDKPDKPTERKITTVSTERRRFERDEINRLAENDENIAWLLQESQSVLGKTLGAVATDTIAALYSYYGMKPDLIMMVLQYCVSIGKANMRYIEKVAASWIESGIETHEQAEREIQRKIESRAVENRIKSAFGIYDRNIVPAEKKYIQIWTNDYGFDVPLITLAFERAVEAKGKLSFAYINGILTNWHAKGITTPAEALRDTREDSPKKKSAEKSAKESSYDLGELEEMLNQGTF